METEFYILYNFCRESSLADILEGIPPTFSRKPKAKYVNEGEDVILECRLVAVPEPEITWYYKDMQITTKENIVVATESDMHMYCSVIKITKVQKKQEGKYTIIAKNREGEATIEIPMKVCNSNTIIINLIILLLNIYSFPINLFICLSINLIYYIS